MLMVLLHFKSWHQLCFNQLGSLLVFQIFDSYWTFQKPHYISTFFAKAMFTLAMFSTMLCTGIFAPYLLALVNRNDPICVVPPKVAKASTVKRRRLLLLLTVLITNVVNVNDP
jgi:hypothetical protein